MNYYPHLEALLNELPPSVKSTVAWMVKQVADQCKCKNAGIRGDMCEACETLWEANQKAAKGLKEIRENNG